MKALRMALVTGILAGVAGCSRQAPPEAAAPAPAAAAATPAPTSAFDGAATFAYLDAIAKVRAAVNSDNKNRIPALIRGQDIMMLGSAVPPEPLQARRGQGRSGRGPVREELRGHPGRLRVPVHRLG
jgi:hypothetical protein